jgi:hypothetical protein
MFLATAGHKPAARKEVFMKNIKVRFFCIAAAWALLCAGIAAPVSAQSASADELDAAIRAVSDYLNKQLPEGNKLAILNIQSDFPALSEYIIDELIANTVNDRVFSMVDRQQLNTIRTELEIQMSGEVNDESAQSIGQRLGAEIIISGAVSRIGGLYRLRVRALSVQSAQIAGQFNQNIPSGPTIAALVQSSATGAVQASAPVPAAPAGTYKIGDTGPAGGLIFYDKGNDSDGWRYMEAAPTSTELKGIIWGPGGEIKGTKVDTGSGRNNTQVVVNHAVSAGGNYRAAWLCDLLESGGYDDWFLPSKVELNLIYLNLRERGLGGFTNEWYWSSSESSSGGAWTQHFGSGDQNDLSYSHGEKSRSHNVRAIRQF